MRRLDTLLVALLSSTAVFLLLASCSSTGHDEPSRRPNVLLLLADDMQWDAIGALGEDRIRTPNLDRLVTEGTTFTHAYNQGSVHGAVCMPSRAMIITGRHLWRRGGDQVEGRRLWGEVFGEQGYATFVTGKWHNGKDALERGFQTIGATGGGMLHSTKQEEDGYNRGGAGNTWKPDDQSRGGHWQTVDGEIVHSSEHWADEAVGWIGQRATATDDDRPFFAHVAFHAPHDPRQAPTRHLDLYPPERSVLPQNVLPGHPFDNGALRLRDELLAPFPRDDAAIRLHMAEYAAIISHLDEQVGRILDALDDSGMADNTLVVFTADHGLAVGQHGLLGKQSLYDHSQRVAVVWRGPGIAVDVRRDDLVYLHSLFPTAAELTGVSTPDDLDAPSMAHMLHGDDGTNGGHETLFAAYSDTQRMVRDRTYKLIVYPQAMQVQLFNLQADPWETHNIADDPDQRATMTRLHGDLLRWMDATKDPLERALLDAPWEWTVTPVLAQH